MKYMLTVDYIYDGHKKRRYQTIIRVYHYFENYIYAWLYGMMVWLFESNEHATVRFSISEK